MRDCECTIAGFPDCLFLSCSLYHSRSPLVQDTAGQERFSSLTKMFVTGANMSVRAQRQPAQGQGEGGEEEGEGGQRGTGEELTNKNAHTARSPTHEQRLLISFSVLLSFSFLSVSLFFCFLNLPPRLSFGSRCLLVFDMTRSDSFEALTLWRDQFLAATKHDKSFAFACVANKNDIATQRAVSQRRANTSVAHEQNEGGGGSVKERDDSLNGTCTGRWKSEHNSSPLSFRLIFLFFFSSSSLFFLLPFPPTASWCSANGDIPYFEVSAKEGANVHQAFMDLARKAFKQMQAERAQQSAASVEKRKPGKKWEKKKRENGEKQKKRMWASGLLKQSCKQLHRGEDEQHANSFFFFFSSFRHFSFFFFSPSSPPPPPQFREFTQRDPDSSPDSRASQRQRKGRQDGEEENHVELLRLKQRAEYGQGERRSEEWKKKSFAKGKG